MYTFKLNTINITKVSNIITPTLLIENIFVNIEEILPANIAQEYNKILRYTPHSLDLPQYDALFSN